MKKPTITHKDNLDHETVEFFLDGQYITTWRYEIDAESEVKEFKMIFNLGLNYNQQ